MSEASREEVLAVLAKALGHPARVRIMRLLLQQEGCVAGDLVEALPLAGSTVSQHLKILQNAGLIKGQVDGPRRCYCVDQSRLSLLKELVALL